LDNLNEDNIGVNGDSADNFRAPETIHLNDKDNNNEENTNREYQGKPLDIWALGVTLYILTYLKFPFDTDKGILELYRIIKEAKVKFPLEPWYSRKIKFLIKECLEKNPNRRKSAEEILKVLIIHKKESIDKLNPIFKSKRYTIDIPNQELVYSLDFITNLKSAIFENPDNKDEKIVLKNDKKLVVYEVPKERSITKIKLNNNNINIIQKEISISKIEEEKKEIKNSGNSFTIVVSKKITEIKNNDNNNSEKIIEKKVFVNNKLIETEENLEGKDVLKKYIEQK
jgi:serine/threonine protein kinase